MSGESIEAYRRSLRSADLEPVDLNRHTPELDGLAGLVLSGGIDIDPSLYGEANQPEVIRTSPARDAFELNLLKQVLAANLPLLAICRGHQLLNVCLGGSLLQHIEDGEHEAREEPPADSRQHVVSIEPGSYLRQLYGDAEIEVNSRHHQAVTLDRLAPGLKAAALSPDGIVEAVESVDYRWLLGVQWHPERSEPAIHGFEERSRMLFQAFAEAVVAI